MSVLIPAAGRGERLGAGQPKALRLLAGESLLVHAVRAVLQASRVVDVVIAAPAGAEDQVRQDLRAIATTERRTTDPHTGQPRLTVVTGGASRSESVARALHAAAADADVVLVHDAARPLVPRAMIDEVIDAVLAGSPAVVPAVPVADTVRRVDERGTVVETPSREQLRAVQTPQGFARDVLVQAYEPLLTAIGASQPGATAGADQAAMLHTDDAGLVERLGIPISVVPGAQEAFKVTRPIDLLLAEAVLARRRDQQRGDHSGS